MLRGCCGVQVVGVAGVLQDQGPAAVQSAAWPLRRCSPRMVACDVTVQAVGFGKGVWLA